MMQSDEKKNLRKPLYLCISILVAVGIWFFVDQISGPNGGPQTATREITDVPIVFLNESSLDSKGLMLLEDGTDATIDFTVVGTRWLVSNLDRSDIRVTVNLAQIENAGKRSLNYEINFPDPRFSDSNITITKASLYMAAVNISELYSKSVEVRCEVQGNVAEGFSAGQVQLSQDTLTIRGQESDVAPISYAKVIFDIGRNAEETVVSSLTPLYFDEYGRLLKDPDVQLDTDSIQATLPVSVTKELFLAVNFLESPGASRQNLNYEIQPRTITVSGDAGKLKGLSTITLDDFDLLSLAEGVNTYTYPITVPDGCQNLSGVTRATLVISFKDMERVSIPTNRFRCENLPDGRIVDILTEQIYVEIFGTSADVEAITGDEITVTADLSSFGAALGTYTVPAVVECDTDGDIGIAGTYELRVTIRDPQAETEPSENGEAVPDPVPDEETGLPE